MRSGTDVTSRAEVAPWIDLTPGAVASRCLKWMTTPDYTPDYTHLHRTESMRLMMPVG